MKRERNINLWMVFNKRLYGPYLRTGARTKTDCIMYWEITQKDYWDNLKAAGDYVQRVTIIVPPSRQRRKNKK